MKDVYLILVSKNFPRKWRWLCVLGGRAADLPPHVGSKDSYLVKADTGLPPTLTVEIVTSFMKAEVEFPPALSISVATLLVKAETEHPPTLTLGIVILF